MTRSKPATGAGGPPLNGAASAPDFSKREAEQESNGEQKAPLYLYRLRFDRLGRKGQVCQMLSQNRCTARVRFEDGFEGTVSRSAIVRRREFKDSLRKEGTRGSENDARGQAAGSKKIQSEGTHRA